MSKQALRLFCFSFPLLLSLPFEASAACKFAQSGNAMIIVVGKKKSKCYASESFQDAFKAELAATLSAREGKSVVPASSAKKAVEEHKPAAEQPWVITQKQARPQGSISANTPITGPIR